MAEQRTDGQGEGNDSLPLVDGGPLEILERTRRAGVDAMGAALAHELNQPLAALTLYLQSLRKQVARSGGEPEVAELADKASREAERAVDIVRRMRRLSLRIEPERGPVDLNALAEECIEMALTGPGLRIELKRRFQTDLPPVSADAVQVRQVMVNLLRNAAEATERRTHPQIAVATEARQGFAVFTVADNGPGISDKMADRLFRAYETTKPDGLGLGLAISRMIAQNHRGDLVVEPGEIGGACFGLRLPMQWSDQRQ